MFSRGSSNFLPIKTSLHFSSSLHFIAVVFAMSMPASFADDGRLGFLLPASLGGVLLIKQQEGVQEIYGENDGLLVATRTLLQAGSGELR